MASCFHRSLVFGLTLLAAHVSSQRARKPPKGLLAVIDQRAPSYLVEQLNQLGLRFPPR
jgi:hypothetical protein